MGAIRVGHHCVLSIDDHRMNGLAAFVQCGDFGDAFFQINFSAIKSVEFFLISRIIDRLKTGVIGRHRAGIACALNIVLPAHRVNTRAFAPEVAGHQGEIAKTLHIVNAANVLGDAERVIDRAPISCAVHSRSFFDICRIKAGDSGGPFGSEGFQVFKKFIGTFRAFGHECVVQQIVTGNHMRHAEKKGNIRAHAQR